MARLRFGHWRLGVQFFTVDFYILSQSSRGILLNLANLEDGLCVGQAERGIGPMETLVPVTPDSPR